MCSFGDCKENDKAAQNIEHIDNDAVQDEESQRTMPQMEDAL